MTFREAVLVSHRWLGLATSIVLAIAGLTGAIMVWPVRFPGRGGITQLHESLALGPVGSWTVLVVTALAIVLQLGGLFLWFQRRIVSLRWRGSWPRRLFDLHHVVGVFAFVFMLILATTGVGRVVMRAIDPTSDELRAVRRFMIRFHAGEEFHPAVKLLYSLASAGFAVQGATGILMWWRSSGSTGQRLPRSQSRT